MKISALAAQDRPRERLQRDGATALATSELLAIILKSGTQKENVLVLSQRLLAKYPLRSLGEVTLQEFQQIHGIGLAKACQLVALFEVMRRVPKSPVLGTKIAGPQDVVRLYQSRLASLKQEQVIVLYLDTKKRIIASKLLSTGTLDASLVHPREVFHFALRHLAASCLLIHNHPSGDPAPSPEDLIITKQLEQAGAIMGIPLIDHIIIAGDQWWSAKTPSKAV